MSWLYVWIQKWPDFASLSAHVGHRPQLPPESLCLPKNSQRAFAESPSLPLRKVSCNKRNTLEITQRKSIYSVSDTILDVSVSYILGHFSIGLQSCQTEYMFSEQRNERSHNHHVINRRWTVTIDRWQTSEWPNLASPFRLYKNCPTVHTVHSIIFRTVIIFLLQFSLCSPENKLLK